MSAQQAILNAMENILGLEAREMRENLDVNLFESGLLDSLALVSIITHVESSLGRKIDIKQINPESFLTVSLLSQAVEDQARGQAV